MNFYNFHTVNKNFSFIRNHSYVNFHYLKNVNTFEGLGKEHCTIYVFQFYRVCVICGASAHYRHYGVIACERCYKFYRGAIFKQENLTRAENCTGTCDINESTRNNCHSCRFLKCQEQGMKIPKDKLRSRYNLVFKEYWVLVDMYYVVFFFSFFFLFLHKEKLSHTEINLQQDIIFPSRFYAFYKKVPWF